MPAKTLSALIILIIILILGHDVDHFIRGDFRVQGAGELALIAIVNVAKYAFLGFGLLIYMKGKVGPGFWAIAAGIGVALGWLGHFSPFSEQTPQVIYRAYEAPAAGTLAVAWLAALMLALVATTLYAEYLWARASK